MQRSALCRSRRELSNAYFLAKFGFDTAENDPCKVCPLSAYRSPRCPGCEAYHLIADHLGWFDDNSITIEDIMAQRGDLVNSTSSSTPVQIEGLSEAEQTAFRDRLLAAIARSEQTKK